MKIWRYFFPPLSATALDSESTETGKDGEDSHSHAPRFGFAGNFPAPRCVGERRGAGTATGGGGGREVLSGRLRPLFCPGQVSVRYYLWLCVTFSSLRIAMQPPWVFFSGGARHVTLILSLIYVSARTCRATASSLENPFECVSLCIVKACLKCIVKWK